jgi:hypothetical protein
METATRASDEPICQGAGKESDHIVVRAKGNPRLGNMKRHRIITATLSLLASVPLFAPTAASATGPLLSGYGPPGAGAQTILGASLVNGPGGGSGGGSSGATTPASAAATTSGGASSVASTGQAATSQRSATGDREHARGARGAKGSAVAGATAANPRAAGANPNSSHLGGTSAVDVTESATSWFSGSDLLALLLASGALALVALATVRLARTQHD